ncbi:uncharacterized protein [Periplaneta americana]|uniref:uncharacterized protein isoform X1 n=1 Tax=Periplaneta americana TaxID=6978 RepID=UPI0037E99CB9
MSTTKSPLWMDKNLVGQWLSKEYGPLTVTDIEVKSSSSNKDNYLSNIVRLAVRVQDGRTFSLIAKCRIDQDAAISVMRDSSIFTREEQMYDTALPKMYALLKTALPETFDYLAPICFHACETFLLMEDMSTAGFKMADRKGGMNLEQCSLVIRSIARFHASSVILQEREPESLKAFQVSLFHEPSIEVKWPEFFTGLTETVAEEVASWSAEWQPYAEKLRRLAPKELRQVQQVLRRDDDEFNVLTHGDLWVNNILVTDDARAVRFVDYQLAYWGSPAIDLHYFLNTSVNLHVRENHMDTLIQEYHNTLCDTLKALGYKKKMITLEELHKQLDSKIYYAVHTFLVPLANIQSEEDSGYSFDESLETGKNPGPKMLSENYKKALKIALPILDSKGAFQGI